jgi:hypothetical protein
MRRTGMTLMEIMIVAVLGAFILLGVHKIMSRTTATVKKGSEMLNTQLLMELIVERIRSDVRSLTQVKDGTEANKVLDTFTFDVLEKGEKRTVTYRYDAKEKTLFRDFPGKDPNNFRAGGKVSNLSFVWVKPANITETPFLSLSIQIKSDEVGEGVPAQLSFVCNIFPRCMENSALPLN